MSDGDIAIVLHSHMPYVEGFGTYPFGEEWLFDAAARSYLPVLEVAERLTMTVTPVLADQLEAPGIGERMTGFIRELRVGSARADAADFDGPHRSACLAEAERYERDLKRLDEHGGDLLAALAERRLAGAIELLPSAATHAILPLVATDEVRRVQIGTGLRSHRRRFGRPGGFWLPECAYEPGLEDLLAAEGIDYFCVDQSAVEPRDAALRPIATGGICAFTIDWEAISWLWSLDGYPSDPAFADFHRRSLRGARPWAIDGSPYDPDRALERASELGRRFAADVAARLATHRERSGRRGLLTFAIDTELLGHWWWEGPSWLAAALVALEREGVRPITLGEARALHEPESRPLVRSSWGEGKDLRTWDRPAVADLAWGARRAELRLLRELGADRGGGAARERAVRELLALQASDWAFLDGRREAGDYPFERVLGHAMALFEALEAIDSGAEPSPRLRSLAPDLSLAPLLEP